MDTSSVNTARVQSVLLYDGLCGFCDWSVQFILARDVSGALQFAPLQGEFAAKLFAEYPDLRAIDSLILVQPAADGNARRVAVRSDAVIEIAHYLGGFWHVAGSLLRMLPRALRDWGYDTFAKHRFRVFGRLDACRLPSGLERARFIA